MFLILFRIKLINGLKFSLDYRKGFLYYFSVNTATGPRGFIQCAATLLFIVSPLDPRKI